MSSVAADHMRRQHRRWAAPGSAHDRSIAVLKTTLPVAVGVLAAILATAPFTHDREISFVLDKNRVDVAGERLKVVEALYRGEDSKGQPFSLRAGSAVQRSSREPIVRLTDLEGRILVDGQPSLVSASRAVYAIDKERIAVVGPVQFQRSDGYRLTTHDVAIDLRTRLLKSAGRVDGRMPIGTFGADRVAADLSARTVTLEGGARLHIDQSGLRAR